MKIPRPPKTCEAPHWGRYEFESITFGGSGGMVTITPARYAKGKVAVHVSSDGMFRNRASCLAEGVGGKWSNRCGAYIMSPSAAERLHAYYMRGMTYSPISGKFYTKEEIEDA